MQACPRFAPDYGSATESPMPSRRCHPVFLHSQAAGQTLLHGANPHESPMLPEKSILLWAATFAVAVLLVACGGDDAPPPGNPGPTPGQPGTGPEPEKPVTPVMRCAP